MGHHQNFHPKVTVLLVYEIQFITQELVLGMSTTIGTPNLFFRRSFLATLLRFIHSLVRGECSSNNLFSRVSNTRIHLVTTRSLRHSPKAAKNLYSLADCVFILPTCQCGRFSLDRGQSTWNHLLGFITNYISQLLAINGMLIGLIKLTQEQLTLTITNSHYCTCTWKIPGYYSVRVARRTELLHTTISTGRVTEIN